MAAYRALGYESQAGFAVDRIPDSALMAGGNTVAEQGDTGRLGLEQRLAPGKIAPTSHPQTAVWSLFLTGGNGVDA